MKIRVQDIPFTSAQHVIDEIRNMNVKGGSPFGRAAAWAFKLAAQQETFRSKAELTQRFDAISAEMLQLKPTMATIYNSKNLVYTLLEQYADDGDVQPIQRRIVELCDKIIQYSLQAVEQLGVYGGNMIQDGSTVMMHSYSSALMSIFTSAAESGKQFEVICTESRPLRESRLAATILQSLGIPVTYITDASAWEFMNRADYLIMGADSIAYDGSVANKMGTALLSRLAAFCKKPVYIASELYKLDLRTREGYSIQLEQRSAEEVVSANDFPSMDGIRVINQFFDLTPAQHISALITEFGVIAPANVEHYWRNLEKRLLAE